MRHTTNTVAVKCNECGKTGGSRNGGTLRCGECGRFASETSGYCASHDVRFERISGYSHCPRCRERRNVEAQKHEAMARRADPNMHPTVDAPRR